MSSSDELTPVDAGNPIKSVITRLQLEANKYVESQHSSKSSEYVIQKSTHPNQHNPYLIDWAKRCPGLISDFTALDDQVLPVVPSCSQESIVVNDLISCLQGISGRYVTANPLKKNESRTFIVNDKLDSCWKQLATNILPVAIYYSTLTRFVEDQSHFKYGKVNHALAACLLKIRNDYLGIVAKLEDQNRQGELNLHRFYCQVQPYLFSFETIKNICEAVVKKNAKGGKTLSLLHEFASNCTGKEERLCQVLLEAAAVPYMKQLQNWLYHGVIIDPYNEFLIHDNQVVFDKEQLPDEYSDDYWGKCYTINKEKIPVFLDKLASMILSTGKYLNVLRQCGVNTKSTTAEDIEYMYNENQYTEAIQKAYQFASSSLLDHLMQVNDLIGHLKSVKHYLLFDQGDFFMKFMDMSELELNKDIGDILPSRLQTLVELALRTSSASADSYKDNIKTELHQDDIMTLLLKIISHSKGTSKPQKTTKGWESLTFIYEVKWPISLVLNKSSLMIYQLIFRHLFFCKYVERLLCKVWIDNKAAKKLAKEVSNEYKSAWDLRQRMLLYVHNLEYYMMVEVIEPNWNIFVEKLQTVKNLDEVLECHNAFQTTCLVKCMLTSPQHFKVVNTFLRRCVEFCLFIESCSEIKGSPAHSTEDSCRDVVDFENAESFSEKIANFNKAFTQHFNYLFKTIVDTNLSKDLSNDKMLDMLYRLDFNSYYKKSVEEKKKSVNASTSFTFPAEDLTNHSDFIFLMCKRIIAVSYGPGTLDIWSAATKQFKGQPFYKRYQNMTARDPVIKFSPFEALLIGEKNKILKRQPMKNTIYVTRLNQRSKTINLRDLFGLEKTTKTESNEIIFKMPQRVCDFLKHRKLQNKTPNIRKNKKDEILCYEFEGCKVITKNNETLSKGKRLFVRLNKIKFKENNYKKFKYKSKIMHKVVKKFPNPTRKRNYYQSNSKPLDIKNKNKNFNVNRHTLRGKDGKFICKKDYEKLKSTEISPKQKYLSNYLHQLYLRKNKQLFSSAQVQRNKNSPELELPYSVDTIVGLPNLQFDITASETILNEVSEKYYKNKCHEDFQFPQFPKNLKPLDFESDSNLLDIIFENFPEILKFESWSQESDFSTALLKSDILKPEKIVKMYEKKKNGFIKDKEVGKEVTHTCFPVIKLRRINEIVPNMYPITNGKTMFPAKIDEPFTNKNHLITGKSFGSFFFQSAEGKDIFIGNLIKPFLQNSWFGSLPES